MYNRYLLLLLITAVSSAPQGNSDITYVKIQPLNNQRVLKTPYRESRIENLPLTIPGYIGFKKDKHDPVSPLERSKGSIDRSLERSESKIYRPLERSQVKIESASQRSAPKSKPIKAALSDDSEDFKDDLGNINEERTIKGFKKDIIKEKAALSDDSEDSKDDLGDVNEAKTIKRFKKDVIKEKSEVDATFVDKKNKNEQEHNEDAVKLESNERIYNPLVKQRSIEQVLAENLELKTGILSEHNKHDTPGLSESNITKRSPGNPLEEENQDNQESRTLVTPEIEAFEKVQGTNFGSHSSQETTIYDDISSPTESTEPITENNASLEKLFKETDEYESQTNAPAPRFISKLSYFQKNDGDGSVVTNFIERAGKRKFKSKCRCEKIWNCPKLQITVPRCPNEYFMCCF